LSADRSRLRIAVVASGATARTRLTALVSRSGHEIVELTAAPDAILTDDAIDDPMPAPAVAVGPVEGGFAGRLPMEVTDEQVDAALRAVAAGLVVRGPRSKNRNFGPLAEEVWPVLTPREIEILAALSDGLSNKKAARRLGISPHTVKFHIESLFKKLGAASRAEAVAKGLKRQIVEI
jgi:two-component system, NarL family, nitrate/nitrite response regulator NarL